MKVARRIATACTLLLMLQAQTTSTEILGLVTDPTSAVVPGARITITRVATGETRTHVTNEAGEYAFPLIEPGVYTVRAEAQGFRSRTVTDLRVEVQQKARVNFVLEVGEVVESVEVRAAAVALQTEDASLGQVIENKRIMDLPLNGRNVTHLAVMVPGVQFGIRTGAADGQGGFPIPGQSISVIANGQREIHQSVLLDGVEAIMPLYNHTSWTPSIDAVEEFKVQTGSFSAEYGQGAGAKIQVSMKSGTNQLRGTLYEFLRNDKLDAENYFLNFEPAPGAARQPKDRLRRNQFGVFLGGPVVRNRTFWSFNYESRREVKESVATAWWPNQDFRRGDFSALLNPALNPATGRLFRSPILIYDPLTGDPFPNNVLPASRLHRGAQNVISQFLPSPDFQQADILDFTVRRAIPRPVIDNQYYARIDHNFGPADKVFGRIAIDRASWDLNQINPNFPEDRLSRSWNLASQWVHTFNQNVLNELRFGVNQWDDEFIHPRTNTSFDVDSLGIGRFRVASDGNRTFNPRETGVPTIGFTIGDPQGRYDNSYIYQFSENLSIIRGRHVLKAGGQYSHVMMDRAAANLTRGRLTFSSRESGFDFASFLLGYPTRAETGEGMPFVNMRANRSGIYISDDWKATPRLTINMGLRWDYYGNPVDRLGHVRRLDFEHTYTTPAGEAIPTLWPPSVRTAEAKVKIFEQHWGFLQPRLGFAYRPRDKWVIRTSAGQFSSYTTFVNFSVFNLHPPLSGSERFDAVTDVARTIPVTVGSQTFSVQTRRFRPGIPVVTLDDPFGGRRTIAPQSIRFLWPERRESDTWQWSFDIQRQLPYDASLIVGYVGSKNTHVSDNVDGFNSPEPSPDTDVQARRPIQRFFDPAQPERGVQALGSVRLYDSFGNGFYHGLQVRAEKRYARALSYGLAYTFSKAHGDGEDSGGEASGQQNPRDRLGSRARRGFDQTHAMVIHYVWEVPLGKSLTGVAGALLKGWQSNGILTFRSGFPFNPTVGSNELNTGGDGNPIRPDRVRDGRLENPTRKLWYDPTAFRRVSCNIPGRRDLCHYGNAGRNILESPGQRNLDLSVFKNFELRERYRLQFRTEFFNAFNTPWFGEPVNISFVSNDSIVPDGPRAGEIRSLRTDMRIIQFGLKLYFR